MTRPTPPLKRKHVAELASQARETQRPPKPPLLPTTCKAMYAVCRKAPAAGKLADMEGAFYAFWRLRLKSSMFRARSKGTDTIWSIEPGFSGLPPNDLRILVLLKNAIEKAKALPPETPTDDEFWNALETPTDDVFWKASEGT